MGLRLECEKPLSAPFNDLLKGSIFKAHNIPYIKIRDYKLTENAVCLISGLLYSFEPSYKVEPLEPGTTLTVTQP